MKNLIEAHKIKKTYGQMIALDEVDATIKESEFVAIMGPSGSGKSTLLFALSGMDEINSGSVEFCGQNLTALKENQLADIRRTKMGFVFQQATMLKNLNLLDNIILPSFANRRKTAELTEKARQLMAQTGIAELASRDITEVSGGELQRANICRALMSEPKILFADEPTGALNSKASSEVMALLSHINQMGTAILLVTHDAKVAARAERVIFMRDGTIVTELDLATFSESNLEQRTEKVASVMTEVESHE